LNTAPKYPKPLRVSAELLRTSLLTYGSLAFASHPLPSALILLATFFHPMVGIMGVIGVLISNLVARWMGANRYVWKVGVFGVSGLLVGLTLGMYAIPTVRLWMFLLMGAAFSGVLSVFLATALSKRDLPLLSMSFMLVIYPILLTVGIARGDTSHFSSIGFLQSLDKWVFENLPLVGFEWLKLFGSILFQNNLISGVLVLLAIGLYSRISLLYGIWGGVLGMGTYLFLHGSLDGFHGLNYVLTALAFGGFFVVSSVHCWLYTSLAVIAAGITDVSATSVLASISTAQGEPLPSLVFAFNVITLIFLYPLKKTDFGWRKRRLMPVPLSVIKSPEANLRWAKRWLLQPFIQKTTLTFPFLGKWSVLQGNNGQWTHKGIGRYAWDFVVRDVDGNQTRGVGLTLGDYYDFGLPVLAPAPGIVHAIENHIEDNPPRTASTERSWGNYVIINHQNGEFSELSHFKQGSIVVVSGQSVVRGQLLGHCGNSGRSPVPHIHFQLQSAPDLGSATLPARFAEGVMNREIQVNIIPSTGDEIAPIELEPQTEWTLLGKESEQWIFQCKMGLWRFKETLLFTTDLYGYPVIVSKNQNLWYILDKPNFVEIVPDFRTFPSALSPSGWMKIVGESLVLPKKLHRNLIWKGGKVIDSVENLWIIESQGREIAIDTQLGVIKQVKLLSDPKFHFVLSGSERPSK
jgi:urea transporter